MQYLIYTQVDRFTDVPLGEAPAVNGPVDPAVVGLTLGFALQSHWPTDVPIFYGTAPDDADVNLPGILETITLTDYQDALAAELEARRVIKISAIDGYAEQLLSAGAPVEAGGVMLHVSYLGEARTDMTAMAATAGLATAGLMSWPADYARGWISVENVRIPIPAPADGLALAERVGIYYAAIRQHARDLKDIALAAETFADLDAIDISVGWPN